MDLRRLAYEFCVQEKYYSPKQYWHTKKVAGNDCYNVEALFDNVEEDSRLFIVPTMFSPSEIENKKDPLRQPKEEH
ncbi:hypothetical protein OUZ56_011387 [Daphnia magna]|uniref:Uncharacterized protein n=1 Tax=Daphnia magna TaxID=35525 RepID=A0ABQ9YZZ9_9CRUS|nr:hypothetical protein OUZ56_011387 [Daphnia magna]